MFRRFEGFQGFREFQCLLRDSIPALSYFITFQGFKGFEGFECWGPPPAKNRFPPRVSIVSILLRDSISAFNFVTFQGFKGFENFECLKGFKGYGNTS